METEIPLIWILAMGATLGLFLGYALGMALGITVGKQQAIKRIKALGSREKFDFDIEGLFGARVAKLAKDEFLY